ncbi:MAG TPA: helix-turn-helix domain-containing protein [Candidatus Thalassarchaeaceae archaeon]|nr:helix-turn-helix domain-containing protein [Candidatus Thalassarchaeaceae archaeon]
MLPESQARILRLLARYPDELVEAWDVPRELSLPGISESLGLVRSALHEPLKALEEEGLVQTRTAHVIGGGSRKRNVIHLTAKGRQQAPTLVTTAGHSMEIESTDGLHGRESELGQLESALADGAAVLTGIPGIGKTALLQALPSTRFVTMDASMDAQMLCESWLEIEDAPIDLEAQIALLSNISEILVADEVQDVHPRHQSGVHALLNSLIESKTSVAIGMRAPCPFDNAITLSGIDAEAGQQLLGESVDSETAADVCEALDGHPLALHLWAPSDNLPEASDAVQAFVEETVLSRLAEDARASLDTLSAEPRPVMASHLDAIDIDPLDDAALLRWPNGRVEIQHLIRNVRRVAWDSPEVVHRQAAERWSEIEDGEARWFEAYHRTMAGEDTTDFIVGNEAAILTESAAAATLLDDVLHMLPDAHELRRMAASLALERGESDIAADYLSDLPQPNHALLARLHRSQGDVAAAEEAESKAQSSASKADAARMHLSRLAAMLDDRLPNEDGDLEAVEKGLSSVNIGHLDDAHKRSAIVLMAMLRHRIAMLRGDEGAASAVRNDLTELADGGDPLIDRMSHLEALHLSNPDGSKRLEAEGAMRRLVGRTTDTLQRVSLGLALVEAQSRSNPPGAATTLETLRDLPLPLDQAAGRRLDALLWYWHGELESTNRLAYWREAILRFRRAECPRAARSLTIKLHKAL